MTTHDALLRTIIENPDDDFPRLCYADWLEENGEVSRAEFIRAGIELAKWGDLSLPTPPNELVEAVKRHRISMKSAYDNGWHGLSGWISILPGKDIFGVHWQEGQFAMHTNPTGNARIGYQFHRGFISSLTCDWPTFLRVADALIWYSGQTVCTRCQGRGGWGGSHPEQCRLCDGAGRIPRPFPPTAQPIERVTLTDITGQMVATGVSSESDWFELHAPNGRVRFGRAKCPHCSPYPDPARLNTCAMCVDNRNSWHCDRWPGIVFVMPEADYRDHVNQGIRDVAAGLGVPAHIAHGQTWRYGAHGVT